jgi:hypothetical protein
MVIILDVLKALNVLAGTALHEPKGARGDVGDSV